MKQQHKHKKEEKCSHCHHEPCSCMGEKVKVGEKKKEKMGKSCGSCK